jgi:spermidine synthase
MATDSSVELETPGALTSKGAGGSHQDQGGFARGTLLWLVFSSGVAVMGLEMSASRLIAPYFGSTLSVWTSLIGLVMIFLTAGYYLGGSLADRAPSRGVLGALVLVAGLLAMALPLVSTPVLRAAWGLTPKAGLLPASLLATLALFSLPTILLGCVCPFAMKLSISDLGRTGRTSGRVYAVSAMGSVVGTFLPALVTIPRFGVRHSIMVFGALLVVAALLLLARARFLPAAGAMFLLGVPLPPMVPMQGAIVERESPYNYLRVVQAGPARLLIVDWGAFSAYIPGEFRTGEYYDYLLLAPLLRSQPPAEWLRRVLVIGLGAGTVSKQITAAYGALPIDGVEIDPAIVDLGRSYFAMDEANLKVYVTDGRAFLAGARGPYDWVIVDAYQSSDIPFHLVTKEFFRQLRDRMGPQGVLAINVAWWKPDDPVLLGRLVATVQAVFPKVFTVTGISRQSGAVLLAGGDDLSISNLLRTVQAVGHPGVTEIAREVLGGSGPHLSAATAIGQPLTDDRAPIEAIADRMYRQNRRESFQREQSVLKP